MRILALVLKFWTLGAKLMSNDLGWRTSGDTYELLRLVAGSPADTHEGVDTSDLYHRVNPSPLPAEGTAVKRLSRRYAGLSGALWQAISSTHRPE